LQLDAEVFHVWALAGNDRLFVIPLVYMVTSTNKHAHNNAALLEHALIPSDARTVRAPKSVSDSVLREANTA
jgi:hypothetical protein